MKPLYTLTLSLALIYSLLLQGCSTRHASTKHTAAQTASHAANSRAFRSLYGIHAAYKKTPYCYGGTGTRCFDCSGFVRFTYAKLYHKTLPRDTKSQMKLGKSVRKSALKEGDLLFFKTSRYSWHVGIYIEQGKFLHASTSQGVTISRLSNQYWRNHYVKARRVLKR